MINDIYLRSPVNKISSVVVNQCGCSDEIQLNNIIEERDQLRINLTRWMQEASSSKGLAKKNKSFISKGSKRIGQLNLKLKPYDAWHRDSSPKSYGAAFLMVAKRMLQPEVFSCIEKEARNLVKE